MLRAIIVILLFLAILKAVTSESAPASPPAAEPAGLSAAQALLLCQKAIRMLAKDPEKADIPAVQDFGKGNEAYFAWGASTKMARMRNGIGLEVAVTASCTVDRPARKITSLTLNGETAM